MAEWGTWGSATAHQRYAVKVKQVVRRCRLSTTHQKCANLETHRGMANGLALTSGCEFHVYQWVRSAG